jgi:CBS domain-containing protein
MLQINKIKARDIMQTDVVRFLPSTPIEEAVETMEDLHISGAPVLDEAGNILGVLSAYDIAKPEHVRAGRVEAVHGDFEMSEPVGEEAVDESRGDEAFFAKSDYSPEVFGSDTVGEWMSRDVIAVEPEWTLKEICNVMVKQHIHRVPVVKGRALLGIITTFDIVRCIGERG